MIKLLLSRVVVYAATGRSNRQVNGAGSFVAFDARPHDQFVGTMRIVEQRFWWDMLPSHGESQVSRKSSIRILLYRFLGGRFLGLGFTYWPFIRCAELRRDAVPG